MMFLSARINKKLQKRLKETSTNTGRKITVWKASEIAGLTYREMLEKLKKHNVPFSITEEELAREFEEIDSE